MTQWTWPLPNWFPEVPRGEHLGAFGAVRKHDIHTGVDLYAGVGAHVCAVEEGQVVAIEPFTGVHAGSPWWEETWAVMVEGDSGVVCYGEVNPWLVVGTVVTPGRPLGSVMRVLRTHEPRLDIPGHMSSMLHLELYEHGIQEPVWWDLGCAKPVGLKDPTPFLLEAK